MMTVYNAMIYCIKSEINSSCFEFDLHLFEHELEKLYEISKHHDLSHIIGSVLIKNNMLQLQG